MQSRQGYPALVLACLHAVYDFTLCKPINLVQRNNRIGGNLCEWVNNSHHRSPLRIHSQIFSFDANPLYLVSKPCPDRHRRLRDQRTILPATAYRLRGDRRLACWC
jgi:hypothetical protein